jgi:2-phospho-L-lactate guanylyltransferase (CobY/MobA/RfbA family)
MKKIVYITLILLLLLPLSIFAKGIFESAESGTAEQVRFAIQLGADVNTRTDLGLVALLPVRQIPRK